MSAYLLPLASATIFSVMLSIGLLLGLEQFKAALRRPIVLAAVVFAVVVPVPALAVLFVKLLGIKGAVAAGIVLMAISPGAPIALRRGIDAGGHAEFAPVLQLAIVLCAVVTVPLSLSILSGVFDVTFTVSPLAIARQVFVAQLLPVGLGVVVRAFWPSAAARLQPLLARLGNVLLLAVILVLVYALGPMLIKIGWTPTVAGVLLTTCALAIGAASAGRDADARPAAAVAAAMRNPGLALLVATANRVQPTVTAAVFGYVLGAAVVVSAFVAWQGRKRRTESDAYV